MRRFAALAVTIFFAVTCAASAAPNNCMPNPASCGFPDMTTTGTLPGVARTAVSGTVTLSTAGQVYENKTVTGGIVVTAPNVTIRNVKVIKTADWAIDTNIRKGSTGGLQIQDTEVDLNGDFDGYGIVCDNYVATRVFIHNGADGGYLCTNATMRDSLITLGPDTNNDGLPDSTTFCNQNAPGSTSPPHFDGLSSDGGSNQVYDHNTIRNPCSQTSAILLSTNVGTIRNAKITNNLMAGGGYTVYCDAGPDVQGGEIVTGNRIARTYRPQGGYYGPAANCGGASMTYSGNVWDEDGTLLPGQGSSPPPPDTTAPETTITTAPVDGEATGAIIAFSSNEPGTFQCKLDAATYASCVSPQNLSGLSIGTHTFSVRATDQAGNVDATPAVVSWVVKSPPPSCQDQLKALQTTIDDLNTQLTAATNLAASRLVLIQDRDATITTLRADLDAANQRAAKAESKVTRMVAIGNEP